MTIASMKSLAGPLVLAASLALAGCGADSGTTAAQDAAFKKGDKSAVAPPPADANKPSADFKSSIPSGR